MKILNQTYRDLQQEVINKTPVTDLRETSEFDDKSYLHLVQFIPGTDKYESMKILGKAFKQKVYEAVQNTFKTRYWDTHEFDYIENAPSKAHNQQESDTIPEGYTRPEGTAFADLVNYLKEKDTKQTTGNIKYAPVEVQDNDADGFVNHIYYDFDVIKRYMVLKDNYLQSEIDGLNRWFYKVDCYFTQTMKLYTTDRHGGLVEDSVIHKKTDNDTYCQMHIEPGNKISNEWICPATGNLVVFGWLDSSEALNNKAIPSCYCVIEANINRGWEIISAQPVIPAKSITYVGFNLPMKKDLIIRARTGFTCGAKSSQYSNDQDGNDTLSNSVPNGFRCLIFSNDNYKVDEDSIESEDQT